MAADNPPLTLTLPTDLRMLCVARAFVEAVCHICDLDKTTTHAVVLATGEAVTNIIRHAHHGRPEAQLQLQCRLRTDALEITLLDEGEPFDLSTVPHLDPGELRLGGRGVYLMRHLMDELASAPRPGRGNALRMLKRRPPCGAIRDVG
jgi:serine/threonine-protein kinase RsbW